MTARKTPQKPRQPLHKIRPHKAAGKKRQRLPGERPLSAEIERMIRVDHAGEYGAKRIYAGQLAVLGQSDCAPALQHMAQQEEDHLRAFSALLAQHQGRPTILQPLWHLAGFALGAATAALGEKAAMACTAAVEEVIDGHYARQMERLGTDDRDLRALISRFRDEEIEHRQIALDRGARDVPYYPALRALIRAGSKTAIWLSERV